MKKFFVVTVAGPDQFWEQISPPAETEITDAIHAYYASIHPGVTVTATRYDPDKWVHVDDEDAIAGLCPYTHEDGE